MANKRLNLKMLKQKSVYSRRGLIPALAAIVVVAIVGLLASFLVVGNAAQTVTTTQVTTVPTTTTDPAVNSSSQLNAEQIYANANRSIVTIQGTQVQNSYYGNQVASILGSGFVVSYSGANYIVTNYHVAGTTSNLTVTFSNGDSYPAKVIGSDPYSDLAIVLVQAPSSEFYPLTLATSSSLRVGDSVVAIGDPYGLTGSMTEGIISQLGRTIQDETAGNFSIANVIQTSAPINPGNSGGPLLNAEGDVVGITTAGITSSQGLGFAIPSDTIIQELPSLVANGSYNLHSYLGISETDMNYQLSKATGTNVTYGVLIENVVPGGPAATAGLQSGSQSVVIEGQQYLIDGDVIISVNGTRITTSDSLGTYLASHTVAGQTVSVGIIRAGDKYMTVAVKLGARPSL
ncbi:MAG TPA: trypsin-like peptidase domain-containing protein [Nitrososphaerales archaeon]|nr:trypsin-like peptidase domain-containing protein [Nitrososphaerales archaeon]